MPAYVSPRKGCLVSVIPPNLRGGALGWESLECRKNIPGRIFRTGTTLTLREASLKLLLQKLLLHRGPARALVWRCA